MPEVGPAEAANFLRRWGDLHDALVEEVVFDHPQSTARVRLQAQDGDADWAWRRIVLTVEGLKEFTYRQSPRFDVQVVFEAGVIWDGDTVLFALDAPHVADAAEFRSAHTYFGGTRLHWEAVPA